MKTKTSKLLLTGLLASAVAGWCVTEIIAAESNPIKEAMQKYCKAPTKGADSVCKKAQTGAATKEEIHGMFTAFQAMSKCKPPQGDEKSWAEKCEALVKATESLDKGEAGAADKFKAAVNCKACHEPHRPKK